MRGHWRLLMVAGLLALACALSAAPALALPTDPRIENLTPQFSAPVIKGGIAVTYTCPAYATGSGPGSAADYLVRFARDDARGADGRLNGTGLLSFLGEAPAEPIAGTNNCASELVLPNSPDPAAIYLGTVAWQASRRCSGCGGGWEAGPVTWTFVTPNVEGAAISFPRHVYAGYLTRFGFSSTSPLGGSELVLQRAGGGTTWSELARAPAAASGETAFFAKLPAGRRQLRIEVVGGLRRQGLPRQELTVLKPGRERATGAADDGSYAAAGGGGQLSFEVLGDGERLGELRAAVPVVCQGALGGPPTAATLSARLRSARVAPDGSVAGQTSSGGPAPTYATLVGKLRHRRFAGTLTAASPGCSGSRQLRAALR